MTNEMPDCSDCHHSHYDHIGWRPEGDLRTFCRIVRCECKGYLRSYGVFIIETMQECKREYAKLS